jgi:hypothetical protein
MCSYIDNVRFQYFLVVALSSHGCPLLTGISVHCSGRGWSYTLEERGRGCRRRVHRRGAHAVRWEQSSGRGGGGPVRGEGGRRGRDTLAGRRRTSTGGGRAAVWADGRALLKGGNGGGLRRRRVVWQGGGRGPMRRLELTGNRRRWQQTAGPRDAAAVGVDQWRRMGLVCDGGASVDRSTMERERQGRACGIFLVKSRFFRRLP